MEEKREVKLHKMINYFCMNALKLVILRLTSINCNVTIKMQFDETDNFHWKADQLIFCNAIMRITL